MAVHRQRIIGLVSFLMIGLLWFTFSNSQIPIDGGIKFQDDAVRGKEGTLHGGPDVDKKASVAGAAVEGGKVSVESIMPKMPDPEAKKELGRASWKYFHTLLARFPDEPSDSEKTKLRQFVQLYAELYPCGECSHHFVQMLKKYPPQVASRTTAALWGCHVHNLVNEHLGKPEYDCTTILEDYDCGCSDENGNIDASLNLNKVTLEREDKQQG